MVWSALDRQLDPIVGHLIGRSVDVARALSSRSDGVGERCEAIKRILKIEAPSPAYADWAACIVHRVASELAPDRNRIVHDYWKVDGNAVHRMLRKPQGKPELLFDVTYAESLDRLERFEFTLITILAMLTFIEQDLAVWRKRGASFDPHPEYRELTKRGVRFAFPGDEGRRDLIILSSGNVCEPEPALKQQGRVASL